MGRDARPPLRPITCDFTVNQHKTRTSNATKSRTPDWRCPSARRRFSMIQRQNESHLTSAESANGHVHEVVRQAHEEMRQLLHPRDEVVKRFGPVNLTLA